MFSENFYLAGINYISDLFDENCKPIPFEYLVNQSNWLKWFGLVHAIRSQITKNIHRLSLVKGKHIKL